jgi:hypothetical protein
MVRSAWSRTRSNPRTRSGASAYSCFKPAELALDGGTAAVEVAESLRLARNQLVQAGSPEPPAGGLALAGWAAPLRRLALEVGASERPLTMLAARREMIAANDADGVFEGADPMDVARLAAIVDGAGVVPLVHRASRGSVPARGLARAILTAGLDRLARRGARRLKGRPRHRRRASRSTSGGLPGDLYEPVVHLEEAGCEAVTSRRFVYRPVSGFDTAASAEGAETAQTADPANQGPTRACAPEGACDTAFRPVEPFPCCS